MNSEIKTLRIIGEEEWEIWYLGGNGEDYDNIPIDVVE